jgi:hypothetical protein
MMHVRRDDSLSSYIVRNQLGPGEFFETLKGWGKTRECVITVGASLAAVLLTSMGLSWLAILLPLGLLVWIGYNAGGKTACMALCTGQSHAQTAPLIGGMRLKYHQRRKKLVVAGLYIDPEYRGQHGSQYLLQGLLLSAYQLLPEGGTISIYCPTHPASHVLQQRYLQDGLIIGSPKFTETLRTLKAELS